MLCFVIDYTPVSVGTSMSYKVLIMKGFLCIILLYISVQLEGFAQTGILKGTVTDSEMGTGVEMADLMLVRLPDSVKISTKAADEKGHYIFNNLPYGTYVLTGFQFGYHKTTSEPILIHTATKHYHLKLKSSVVETKEVTVTGQRSLVTMDEGKTVVDVENSVGNAGQTVVDVLRKAPGVSVDQDGKIQLKGRGGVQVMLDDKVMYLSEEQLGNLLKSIPSDFIKEIEIITSPSAKYDAVGNGGIINIRLKKGAYEGLNGTFNASYGTGVYRKSNVGVNVTYKKNKLSLNTGYQYNNRKGLSEASSDRNDYNESAANKRFISSTFFSVPMQTHTLVLNGEYKLTPKTSFTFDFSESYSAYKWSGYTNTSTYKQDNSLRNSYYSSENGDEYVPNTYSSLGFKHKLDTNGTTLSGYGAYNYNIAHERKLQHIDYYDSAGTNSNNPFIYDFDNNESSQQYNGQVDFLKKFYNKVKFEAGIKAVHFEIYKPVNLFITENHVLNDASNHFSYEENIYAGYAMATGTVGKFSLQGGLRLERTLVKGTQSLIDSTFTRDYTNLFPSGNITYKQSDKVAYTILYSRRITRPGADQLNPVLSVIDPYSASGGDPYLLPQYTDNAELAYSLFGGVLITTFNYTHVTHPIVYAYKLDKATNRYVSGPRNLDYQRNYGLNISLNKSIRKWWSSNNNLLINNNTFVGQTDFGTVNNQMTGWGVKTTHSLTLPKNYSIEISGLYDSPTTYAYSYSFERWQANAAIQKKFWNKKATIKLAANDIFRTFLYAGTNTQGTTSQVSSYRWDNRTLILSFSYKFGNQLMKGE